MKAFIVTRAAANRFRVLPVIKKYNWDATFVCDTIAQAVQLTSMGVDRSCVHVTGYPDKGIQGVSLARDYVVKNLMPKGKWCIWIDDNVGKVTGLRSELIDHVQLDFTDKTVNWRKEFEHELTTNEMFHQLHETIAQAEEQKTIFAAFANETNFFWRGAKWQRFAYCRTQFALYKNDGSTWMPFDTMMLEDLYKSVDVVARYGSVVINRYVKPIKPMFEPGGIGSFERRLPWLQDNCAKIAALFPGLVRQTGEDDQYGTSATGYHLKFAKRSQKTIDQWRSEHGYLPKS